VNANQKTPFLLPLFGTLSTIRHRSHAGGHASVQADTKRVRLWRGCSVHYSNGMASFGERLIGAAKLDVRTYEEVEHDPGAIGQAIGVVVLSSLAAGVAASTWGGGASVIAGILGALVGWLAWAWITFFIGTRLLPAPQTRANWGQLLRTTGFASAPGILRILAVIPLLGWLVYFVSAIWMLAAFVVAVRQALDYTSTLRAVGVCLIGWIFYAIVSVVLVALFRF
jgi:hypothetical protein